jgi:hypothetical protein
MLQAQAAHPLLSVVFVMAQHSTQLLMPTIPQTVPVPEFLPAISLP